MFNPHRALLREANSPGRASTSFHPQREGTALPRSYILVVDDERDILDLLTDLLSDSGYAVEAAMTVSEAVTCLDNRSYELVIADWRLPDGDGLFVADAAAALGARTMLMSGDLSNMRGGRADNHDTVMKPFEPDELLHAVEAAVGRVG